MDSEHVPAQQIALPLSLPQILTGDYFWDRGSVIEQLDSAEEKALFDPLSRSEFEPQSPC